MPKKNNLLAISKKAELSRYHTVFENLSPIALISPEEARRNANIAFDVFRKPTLEKCSDESKWLAVYSLAKIGLNPDPVMGHVAVVPFKHRDKKTGETVFIATVLPMYQGLIELARLSGKVLNIRFGKVYRSEIDAGLFEFRGGIEQVLTHTPYWMAGADPPKNPKEDLVAIWIVTTYKDGSSTANAYPAAELAEAMKKSRAKDEGPWITDWEAMIIKTAIKRESKSWPKSPPLAYAVAADEAIDRGDQIDTLADLAEAEIEGADSAPALLEGEQRFRGPKPHTEVSSADKTQETPGETSEKPQDERSTPETTNDTTPPKTGNLTVKRVLDALKPFGNKGADREELRKSLDSKNVDSDDKRLINFLSLVIKNGHLGQPVEKRIYHPDHHPANRKDREQVDQKEKPSEEIHQSNTEFARTFGESGPGNEDFDEKPQLSKDEFNL